MSTLLQVNDITKIYPNQPKPGLDHVSFDVMQGEFLGIMGASGSGKTTLLNVLSTIDIPTSGSISMGKVKIQELNQTQAADFRKDNLGFIFQEYFLLDSLTVQENIQELLENHLRGAGYSVALASDGVEAISLFSQHEFDLVLLDIMLPKIDGYGVCELIRKQSQVPIVMVTALDSEADQIKGLDFQIDDYITKPFSMPILKRKIAAILRRTAGHKETEKQLRYKNIVLDLEGYKAFVDNTDIDLTAREFEVLREFLQNQGRVYTRQNLLNTLWNYDFYGDERIIDTHIKNIRKKVGADIIETIRGVGYRIAKENK